MDVPSPLSWSYWALIPFGSLNPESESVGSHHCSYPTHWTISWHSLVSSFTFLWRTQLCHTDGLGPIEHCGYFLIPDSNFQSDRTLGSQGGREVIELGLVVPKKWPSTRSACARPVHLRIGGEQQQRGPRVLGFHCTISTVAGIQALMPRPFWDESWLWHLLCVTCGNSFLLFLRFLICKMGIPTVIMRIKCDNIQTMPDK